MEKIDATDGLLVISTTKKSNCHTSLDYCNSPSSLEEVSNTTAKRSTQCYNSVSETRNNFVAYM